MISAPETPNPSLGTPSVRATRWGRWLLGAVFACLFWFVLSRRAEAEIIARTLARGRWEWLLAAAALQILYYGCLSLAYREAFRTVGIPARARDLWATLLAALAVGEIAPVGWIAGSAVFVRYAVHQSRGDSGIPPERALLATLLAQAADLLAFSLTFTLGMAFLITQHALHPYELAGAAGLFVMNAVLCGGLVLSLWRPGSVTGLLRRLPWAGALAAAERLTRSLTEASLQLRANPRRPVAALTIALGAHALNVTSLFLIFVAFSQPVRIGPLIAGYGVGTLSWMLSPIPTGVGVVEGAMALVYTSVGIPASHAVVIAIAYRGLNFWLPLLVGMLCLRRVSGLRWQEK